jgi:hypothetical protein
MRDTIFENELAPTRTQLLADVCVVEGGEENKSTSAESECAVDACASYRDRFLDGF